MSEAAVEYRDGSAVLPANVGELSAPEIDALASDLLREMAECEREIKRYEEARFAERIRVDMRYGMLVERQEHRREELMRAVHALAERVDFGKKKSRDVGFGTYGRRTVPERVMIADPAACLAWALRTDPALVRVVEKRDVPHSAVHFHFKNTGELPDGCEHTPARDEPFARPEA